jgi:hypothetical protein
LVPQLPPGVGASRAVYLGDIGFFKRELVNTLTEDNEDDNGDDDEDVVDNEEADDHEDEGFDDGGATWDLEH